MIITVCVYIEKTKLKNNKKNENQTIIIRTLDRAGQAILRVYAYITCVRV